MKKEQTHAEQVSTLSRNLDVFFQGADFEVVLESMAKVVACFAVSTCDSKDEANEVVEYMTNTINHYISKYEIGMVAKWKRAEIDD